MNWVSRDILLYWDQLISEADDCLDDLSLSGYIKSTSLESVYSHVLNVIDRLPICGSSQSGAAIHANADGSRECTWRATQMRDLNNKKPINEAALRIYFKEFMVQPCIYCKYWKQTNTKWLPELFLAFEVNTIFHAYHLSLAYMKLSKDPGRPKAVHLFMFMFYWCEQRELCPGKVNQSFFRLALTLRGVGFSHPFILTFYSCRFLSLLYFTFLSCFFLFLSFIHYCCLCFFFFPSF